MKSNKPMNPLFIAAGAIMFVDLAMPLLTGLLEVVSIKLNKHAVRDQVETANLTKDMEENAPVQNIGFEVPDLEEDVED